MILVNKATSIDDIGGKAFALLSLNVRNTPPLVVVPASYFEEEEALNEKLQQELKSTLDEKKLYAVRSSAIDEDSGKASFAGIHNSFLNVSASDVYKHIQKVYESAFSNVAIEYRRANGIRTDNIKIAVIIQEMVDADFAGVAFTVNPVTNNPDEIVIAVTEGLGEKLVDGSVSGSTYTVNGKTVTVKGADILSKKQLRSVLNTVREVAEKTDCFQDIEFALKGNKTFFLQARPIIAYSEIDPHNRTLLIDNANIIESYFGVTSPLTFSFAKDVYRDVYTATLRYGRIRSKIINALSPSLSEMLYMHEGRIYYNMKSWYHVTSIFPFKSSTSYMENMMGVKSGTNDFKRVKMNAFDMLSLGVAFLDKLRRIDFLSDRFEENFNRIVKPYYGREISGSNDELYRLFKTIENDIVKEFAVPIVNDCAVMIYFGILREKAKKIGISPEELNKYISNQGDVKSVGSASELIKIIEYINENAQMKEDFEKLGAEALAEKYYYDSPISEALKDYMMSYGARVRDELKLETVTMIEDPQILFRLIKDSLNTQHRTASYDAAVVPKKIRRLAEKTRKFIKNRERLRLKRTYIYSVVRNIFLAYGRNYCVAGRIDSPRDIFYLTKNEIFSGEGDFRALISVRRAEEEQNIKKPTYNRIVFYGDIALPIQQGKQGEGLCGIPSGNGVVRANVSLMRTADDHLKQGNIILTERTDPGWITLFPKASGLIVEHGSMLSHSFVVARELNLPAVVGVENATSVIPNGAIVTLDGTKGEITVENKGLL
ncbi:MAG: hypothetical protein E7617_05125 [Ruminococcaceae bacterium]|nr:hypothetical protein [Oscillospiraceae bacterium]